MMDEQEPREPPNWKFLAGDNLVWVFGAILLVWWVMSPATCLAPH